MEETGLLDKEFDLFSPKAFFTDDSILTVALAETILNEDDYGQVMIKYYHHYPDGGYGGNFHKWASSSDPKPYNSWGNGSAMLTIPVGYAFDNLEEVLTQAEHYAAFTHNHPEGIKGAQATSAAIFLARQGTAKEWIKSYGV